MIVLTNIHVVADLIKSLNKDIKWETHKWNYYIRKNEDLPESYIFGHDDIVIVKDSLENILSKYIMCEYSTQYYSFLKSLINYYIQEEYSKLDK